MVNKNSGSEPWLESNQSIGPGQTFLAEPSSLGSEGEDLPDLSHLSSAQLERLEAAAVGAGCRAVWGPVGGGRGAWSGGRGVEGGGVALGVEGRGVEGERQRRRKVFATQTGAL